MFLERAITSATTDCSVVLHVLPGHRRDHLDLDQPVGADQRGDSDQGARWGCAGLK